MQSCHEHNLDSDMRYRYDRFARHAWPVRSRTGIKLHDAGQMRDCLHARERENHTNKLNPKRAQTFMAWLEEMRCEVRRAYRDQCHDHNHSWRRQCDRETARVPWSQPIDKPEESQNADRGERNVILEKLQPEDVFCAGNDIGQTGP